MRPGRGRKTAIVTMLMALPVAVAALWRPLEEEWSIRQLRSPDVGTKSHAARRLGEMQCFRAIVPMLEALEREENEDCRELFSTALEKLRRPAAVPYLVQAARHEKLSVRRWAVRDLASLELRDSVVFETLVSALGDPESDVRASALSFFDDFGPTARAASPAVNALLSDPKENIRGMSMRVLERMDCDPLPSVLALLTSPRSEIRAWACGHLPDGDARMVPALTRVLATDTDSSVRQAAAKALGKRAPADDAVLQPLLEGFASGDHQIKNACRDGLLEAGAKSIPELIVLVRKGRADVLRSAIDLLGDLDGFTPELLATLRQRSEEADEGVRQAAAQLADLVRWYADVDLLVRSLQDLTSLSSDAAAVRLSHLGSSARATIPTLMELLSSDNPLVRIEAARVLVEIDFENPPPLGPFVEVVRHLHGRAFKDKLIALFRGQDVDARATPFLIEALGSDDWQTVSWASAQLKAIGPEADAAVPALQHILGQEIALEATPGQALYSEALDALGRMGTAAVPVLLELLLRPQTQLHEQAIDALERIGPAAAPAVPALLDFLRRRPIRLQVAAAYALGRIGSAAVPGLTAALADPSADARCLAAFALGRIGPEARPALDALRAAVTASNADPTVRLTVERAIERIAPQRP